MRPFEYPALYTSSSELSRISQSKYYFLMRSEYFLLLVASVLSMSQSVVRGYLVLCAAVVIASLAVLIVRSWTKPEQDWYKGRALAESIKTSCWRYCMRAEPFGGQDPDQVTRKEFRNHLRSILEANRHIGERIPPTSAAEDQITKSMEDARSLSLEDRKAYYTENRIVEQRGWYALKAGMNRRASRNWVFFSVAVYSTVILMLLSRIAWPNWSIWPVEPLLVVASSAIGWTQAKKFNELASSYTLTAHEIGILQAGITEVSTNSEFSEFVNSAEQAFSREHTQWVARQQSA